MSDEGATPRELLLEACRRNNTSLLHDLLSSLSSPAAITQLLNTATDGIGNYCLHVAASRGSYDALDMLLDQEGVEVDPIDRLERDTPLHKAVRWINGLETGEWEGAATVVELLLDAGSDPRFVLHDWNPGGRKTRGERAADMRDRRIRNKAKLKAFELVDPRNTGLRSILQKAEFANMAGADVIDGDEDEGPTGSASDSE